MGVRLLPEWVEQDAILIAWPRPQSDWQPWLNQVEKTYLQMAQAICRFQTLIILCYDTILCEHVTQLLKNKLIPSERVVLLVQYYNDTWTRDYAPLSAICDDKPCLLNFTFNGWGGKYPADLDNAVNDQLQRKNVFNDTQFTSSTLELEGGAIETDGLGTLLTTRQCQLESKRNPGMEHDEIIAMLKSCLGHDRILFIQHGKLIGDDTDGHIDSLARFCSPDTIAYVSCHDSSDPHYVSLQKMQQELQDLYQPDGKPYKLVELPLPEAIMSDDGDRLPATYANFLIINQAILLPVYNQSDRDSECQQRLSEVFPNREIITINALPLIQQYGSVHCATMQLAMGTVTPASTVRNEYKLHHHKLIY
ncbi:MAG TPA: agmatine deiminase family protein [Gammaproteobacteria bacterium]|nr:agmatine deiminase family protein [Gammaproteobacteria bacterium]